MPLLHLQFNGDDIHCGLNKVDRTKLYGYVRTEVVDENEKPCKLATLASDGKTLIPSGGVALAYVSPKGLWREKSALKPVDLDGNEIEPVTSTFKAPVDLTDDCVCAVEDFLDHNIRMVYALAPQDEAKNPLDFPEDLVAALKDGKIYKFPFSYRGGLSPDTGFLMEGGDGTIWMLVGKKTDIQLIGYEQQGVATTAEEDSADDDEDLDFGMM